MEIKEIQGVAFEMIAMMSEPKYKALQAYKDWRQDKDVKKAQEALTNAELELAKAGQKHLELIQNEAAGQQVPFSLLLMHAEDQYINTQTIIELLRVLIHD